MKIEKFKKRDLSVSFLSANFYVLILGLPIFVIFFFLYSLFWGELLIPYKYPYWIIYLLGVVVHEVIHGLFAVIFSEQGWKSIKFGISWKLLTPYCHCSEALKVSEYRIVVLAPLIILGVIPAIIGILIGHDFLYSFGIIFTLAAGGDLIIIWKLRKESKSSFVLDCTDKCGCEIIELDESVEEY